MYSALRVPNGLARLTLTKLLASPEIPSHKTQALLTTSWSLSTCGRGQEDRKKVEARRERSREGNHISLSYIKDGVVDFFSYLLLFYFSPLRSPFFSYRGQHPRAFLLSFFPSARAGEDAGRALNLVVGFFLKLSNLMINEYKLNPTRCDANDFCDMLWC